MNSQNVKRLTRETVDEPSTNLGKINSKNVRFRREKRAAMAQRGIRSLVVAVAIPLSLALCNVFFFGSAEGYGAVSSSWRISKPFWFPPLWALHMTCVASSFLMALSAWLVWADGGFHRNPTALYLYLAQLCSSLAWDPVVFRMAAPWVGLLVCSATFGALVGCSRQFKEVNPIAGNLVMPCLAWASFLAIVNLNLLFL